MMIAAAVQENSLDTFIPETLEQAAGILIFDDEHPGDTPPAFVTEHMVQAMVDANCEALLCGMIYDGQLFEAIAQQCITRYLAAGMTVRQAVSAMNAYALDLICDYVGGPGCASQDHHHHHEHDEHCDGHCDSCQGGCSD